MHLGTIQGETFKTLTYRVLQRHGYVVDKIDDRPEIIVIKTQWKFREIYKQEIESGIKDGKYMIIVEARSRARMDISGGATLFNVKMRVEHMVKKDDNDYWKTAPVNLPFKDILDGVRNDLKLEYLSKPRYSYLQ